MYEAVHRKAWPKKAFLLRLDPEIYDAIHRWADAELRTVNAQIEFLLRQALKRAGRLPRGARQHQKEGDDRERPKR
jgi:hypothetical protein